MRKWESYVIAKDPQLSKARRVSVSPTQAIFSGLRLWIVVVVWVRVDFSGGVSMPVDVKQARLPQ